jgi:rSAM/selenodomain-associated transferase 1
MAAVLVLARAPRAGDCKSRLEPLLGPAGCARLQAAMLTRAARWAAAVAPGNAFLAYSPADAAAELRALLGDGIELFAQGEGDLAERRAAAGERVLNAVGGPLLIVGTDLPGLDAGHAEAALSDLAEDCDLTLGPATDGGFYLLGIRDARPELAAIQRAAWGGPDAVRRTFEAVTAGSLRVGLLHAERTLNTPADARALLADPTAPPDIVAALRPAGTTISPNV